VTGKPAIRTSVAALAVGFVALALYAISLRNGFAYDDVPIVQGDPRIRSLENIAAIFTGGYWNEADLALYRPLTTLSFAFDWSLAPDTPAWFHFTNILLHAGASVLGFLLLARFFAPAAALAGGLVFAAHPVHVEAVANVVGRAELLSSLFAFACCLAWLGPPARPASEERSTPWRISLAAVFLLAALLSKEGAIMVPAMLVLLDVAARRLELRRAVEYLRRNGVAFAALLLIVVAYGALRYAAIGSFAPSRLDPVLEVVQDPGQRILTALQAWPWYLRLLLFPVTLLADYGPRMILPATGWTRGAAVGLLLLASALVGGVIALARGNRRFALGLLWFPVTVLPVSNLIVPIGVLIAERTLYLPSFAIAIAVSGLTAALLAVPTLTHRSIAAAVAAVVLLLSLRVATRIPEWTSTDRVMVALTQDRPDSFRGHWHLARMARSRRDVARALTEYETAIALWPHRKRLLVEAGAYAAEQRQLERAASITAIAAEQWPDDVDIQRMRAGIALDLGDRATARAAIDAGLRLQPRDEVLRRMAAALDSLPQVARNKP
jgi:hypothetical protein